MSEADAILAEYSGLVGDVACKEHTLRDLGERMGELAAAFAAGCEGVEADMPDGRFRLGSGNSVTVREIQEALGKLDDLESMRDKAQSLAATLAKTRHAHMVRS